MPKKKSSPKVRQPKRKKAKEVVIDLTEEDEFESEPKKTKAAPKPKAEPVVPVVEEPKTAVPKKKEAPVVQAPPPEVLRAKVVLSGCAKLIIQGRTFLKGVPFFVEGQNAITFFKNNSRFDVTEL